MFAVDIIGQAGMSLPYEILSTRAQCAEWLTSVLDGLGIDRARLVGMSFGGWLALNYAIMAPERLDAIALISPGGLLLLSKQLAIRAMLASLVPFQACSDLVFTKWISTKDRTTDADQRAMSKLMARQLYLGLRVRPDMQHGVPPPPFSDDELRALRTPALLLMGDQEVIYDPAAALSRARRLIPGLVSELIPGASHDLVFRRADIVNARLLEFFSTLDDRAQRPHAGGDEVVHPS